MTETKSVPASVLKRKVKEMADSIEATTGRKPGQKERREIKDDAHMALLPMAFEKQSATMIWIDPVKKTMVVDAASQKKADLVATFMVKVVEGLALMMPTPVTSPAMAMATWLVTQEPPAGFTIDRDCELKAADESKAVVRYTNHALDIEEVRDHIHKGMMPTRLAMTYDNRVSFVLTDAGTLRSIGYLDVAIESHTSGEAQADAFDADVVITTSELQKLNAAMLEALGGVAQATIGDEAEPAAAGPAPHHGEADTDPMLDQAIAIVRKHKKASISLVQRHLTIGYNRAARLLEEMEKRSIVSPMTSAGFRTLLAA